MLPTAAAATMLALALAGCSGAAAPQPTASSSPPPASTSPTASPTPSPSATSQGEPPRCLASDLSGTAVTDEGGGAAGSFGLRLVLVNEGAASCSLQGWPGVSFVGGGDGTQLGEPATQDRSGRYGDATVVLEPGGSAYAPLMVEQALNYSNADCQSRDADGFRVYPPGDEGSLFIETDDLIACTTGVELLEVGPMQAG
ncbi:hypothetical protein GCM10025874_24470 [Arenivirga flava]|uniref:DUF4232 domain-containing protein n=2 Tax=Arenivirga flava TaxID=1930060 RepID=A0AA37UHR7_9MICO|nr:hypothetical protein GCM10025874_24470 [Arenivirga flava]